MAKRGRPPTLRNQELIDKIIENIRNGVFVETAVKLSGISKTQFYEWLKIANKARKKEKKSPLEIQMIEFSDRIRIASASANRDLEMRLLTHPDWKAAAWVLERKNPKLYTIPKEIKADLFGEVKTETAHKLSDAQLKALGDALAESRTLPGS